MMKKLIKKCFGFVGRYYPILILAFFIALLLSGVVTNFAAGFARISTVTVEKSSAEGRIFIAGDHWINSDDVSGFSKETIQIGDVDYIGYLATEENSKISLYVKMIPSAFVKLAILEDGGTARILVTESGLSYDINTAKGDQEQNHVNFFPFRLNATIYYYAIMLALYVIMFIIISAFLIALKKLIDYIISKKINLKYNYVYAFLGVFVFVLAVCWIYYSMNRSLYIPGETSDAYYYLHPEFIAENGQFSVSYFVSKSYSFRGYLPSAISFVLNGIADPLGLDVMYMQMIPPALLVALTFGVALPQVYNAFTNKKPRYIQAIVITCIFLLFWLKDFMYTLTDIPSSLAALSALSLFVIALKSSKIRYFVFSGLLLGIATAYRASYSLMIDILFVVSVVLFIYRLFKTLKDKGDKTKIKAAAISAVSFIIAAFFILTPQFIINTKRDKLSFYPFDGDWFYDGIHQQGISVTDSSINSGLRSYSFMAPEDKDVQMAETRQQSFPDKIIVKRDFVYIALDKPIDLITVLVKKAFIALDKKPGGTYGGYNIQHRYMQNLFSLFNYILFGIFFYYLVKMNKRQWPQSGIYLFALFIFVLSALPQIIMHIEQRYFMLFYTLVQFIFSFYFVGDLLSERNEKLCKINGNLLTYLSVYVALSFAVKLTMTNFF